VQEILFFLIAGIGIGSLYAMLGAGLVVAYQGSGVINFAHGALAMYAVATFDRAWNKGEIFLPWVDILPTTGLNLPVRITLSDSGGVPMGVALAIALSMSVLLGLGAHYLVFRPLRNAAVLGKVVASLGLALYLQGVALLNFGTSYPTPKSLFPRKAFQNFLGLGRPMALNPIMALVATIILGALLWAMYRYTVFGLATRGASRNEKGAILLGYSPQSLAARNWVLSSVLAGLAAIIVGPIQGAITPVGLTALVVPALTAALIGNLSSIPLAMAGGLGLGMVETLLDSKKEDWFSWTKFQNGITATLPLIIIVTVLYVKGRKLPIRGSVEEKRLPPSPVPRRVAQHAYVWFVVLTFFAFVFQNRGIKTVFAGAIQTSLMFMIVTLSLTVLTGYTGQISLAQMSFAGVAAFFMARMMADGSGQGNNLTKVAGPGFPWPLAALLGILAGVVVGILIGLPAVRIRGVQLAIVTISAAIAIQSIYLDNAQLTGLVSGSPANIKTPTFFGINIGSRSARAQNERPAFIIFEALVLIGVAVALANMRRSGVGRRFLAMRANERATASTGVNITRTKLLAFALSAGIGSIGGIILAFKQVQVSSQNFPYTASLAVLAFAYLGGITSINGAMVSGLLMAGCLAPVFSNYFYASTIERYLGIIGGLGMIVTAIVHPEGIAPYMQHGVRHAGNWIVDALPGMRTIVDALQTSKRQALYTLLAALVAGSAVWLYHLDNTIIDNNLLWAVFTGVLAWLILLGVAAALGTVTPSFGEAASRWARFAVRFGPTIVVGYILGWIIWPLRDDRYSSLYMPIVGAGLALLIRSIVLQIYRAVRHIPNPIQHDSARVHTIPIPAEPARERTPVQAAH
jgi:branched-subunit amino acid ABC-type transport system permease component